MTNRLELSKETDYVLPRRLGSDIFRLIAKCVSDIPVVQNSIFGFFCT